MRYVAYGDDSGSADKRFRCLAVVSSPPDVATNLCSLLADYLSSNGISELKFEEVRGYAPKMLAAHYFLEKATEMCSRRQLRVDVLLWDVLDTRHNIVGRDDDRNNQLMYYKNLVHIAKRWNIPQWSFYPDEQAGVDWNLLRDYLNSTRLQKAGYQQTRFFATTNPFLDFEHMTNNDSKQFPLIQLADLFGGLSRFSREKGRQYLRWLYTTEAKEHPTLFTFDEDIESTDSKADIARFSLLREFDQRCKKLRLGVSLRTQSYLCTFQPKHPINFWTYEPQHENDRAPRRTG